MAEFKDNNQNSAEAISTARINVDIDLAKSVGALVSPVNKILDMVGSAAGVVGIPLRKLLEGRADAYVMDENAKVMEKHKGLPIEYSNGNIIISTKDLDYFHQRMLIREWHQMEQRESNLENIIQKALEKVKTEPDVDSQGPDEDWLFRFFTSAQDIGTEEMQDIWASVLAGTTKNSKAYSLRTLTTLHNMSKDDAELFMSVCCHRVIMGNRVFIPRYNDFNDNAVSYDEILHLSECGLLTSLETVALSFDILKDEITPFVLNEDYVLRISSKKAQAKLYIPEYPFTIPGKELSNLIKQQMTLDESKKFAAFVMERNKNILEHYSMHKMREKNNVESYEPEPLLKL